MKRISIALLLAGLLLVSASLAMAEPVNVYPGNIGSGTLSVEGTGFHAEHAWLTPDGYDFASNRHSLDMSSGNTAMQGFVDLSGTASADPSGWSKFYAKFSIRDNSNRVIAATFGNDWLAGWHGLDPQPWDRIALETVGVDGLGDNTPHASQYYCTEGGTHDMGGGGNIYSSTRQYYFQLIADPFAQSFTLQAYGMGSSAPITDGWPAQNTLDTPTWLEIGSIDVGNNFNFSAVETYVSLWASPEAGANDISIVHWEAMNIGDALTFSQEPVPEPGSMLALGSGIMGLAGYVIRRRRT